MVSINLTLWKIKMLLEWNQLWTELKVKFETNDKSWTPTTEAMFYEILGAVPPMRQAFDAFLSGEPWSHTRQGGAISAAFKWDRALDQYAARYMTAKEFDEWHWQQQL
jgi:hypothetical protein